MAKVPSRDLREPKEVRMPWAKMSSWVRKEAEILHRIKRQRLWICANLSVRKRCNS